MNRGIIINVYASDTTVVKTIFEVVESETSAFIRPMRSQPTTTQHTIFRIQEQMLCDGCRCFVVLRASVSVLACLERKSTIDTDSVLPCMPNKRRVGRLNEKITKILFGMIIGDDSPIDSLL